MAPYPFKVVSSKKLHTYVIIWTDQTCYLKSALKHIIHEGSQGNFGALFNEINLPTKLSSRVFNQTCANESVFCNPLMKIDFQL